MLSIDQQLLAVSGRGDLHATKRLIRAGASVRVRTEDGSTPLILASRIVGGSRIVDCLLEAGADANACSRLGQTALMLACAAGRLTTVARLLQGGASFDFINRKRETALTYAVVWNQVSAVRILLDAGANSNLPGAPEWSPVMSAAFEGNRRIVQLLIEHGAQCDRCDGWGRIAADIALQAGHCALSRVLR